MLIRSCTALLVMSLSSATFAGAIYSFDQKNPTGSDNAGDLKNVSTSYDSNTGLFNWSYTIGRNSAGDFSDGFWLVVTDGENPKQDANEYAILYGDTDSNKLTAYEYSGQNNANSFAAPGNLLASQSNAFSLYDNIAEDIRTISFSLSATDINANNGIDSVESPGMWKGLNFAEKIGIWFHASTQTEVGYNGDRITSFDYDTQGWYDVGNKATSVPEPAILSLLGFGLAAVGVARRRTA